MRFVIKPDCHKTNKLASENTYEELLDIAQNERKDFIKDSIYRDSYTDEDEKRSYVVDKLALSYLHKCGYCETICKADVEHYRPKNKVDEDENHPGYYWLCYEWTNLIPACVKCNRDGGKHSKFPILGNRVYQPEFLPDGNLNLDTNKARNQNLINEMPLLVHPEIDVPDEIFEFELDNRGDGIRIVGVDGNIRGEETIRICKLNRQELRLERVANTIDNFKESVESTFNLLIRKSISEEEFEGRILEQIQILKNRANSPEKTHTLLRKYISKNPENFEKIVIPHLTPKARKIILEAFSSTF